MFLLNPYRSDSINYIVIIWEKNFNNGNSSFNSKSRTEFFKIRTVSTNCGDRNKQYP